MTCHNRKLKTLLTLESLFKQTLTSEIALSVYLVDDGSTDGTSEGVQQKYPQVKLFSGDGNLFWNGGMRIAFSEAMKDEPDYYLWLNDDTVLAPEALNTLLATSGELFEQGEKKAIVVIVPKFLRWMVPEGVAEVWTVPISLKNGQNYYPNFAEFVEEETKRFDEIYVSEAHSHPSQFDITRFTRVPKHNFEKKEIKITFIWREYRLLVNRSLFRVLRKIDQQARSLSLQNLKIQQLLEKITLQVPEAKFAVAGLGTKNKFPEWIEDYRVESFNEKIEKEICGLYSQSRLLIGLQGSNMLLPSAHAGMTIDFIDERWGNFAQDIYQESDPRMATFR
jgi:glycosyltransferase involved in cell wall biosynthesis